MPQHYHLPDTVLVGIVVGTHGIYGEIRVQPHTDNPHRFSKGNTLLVAGHPVKIVGARHDKGHVLVKLEGVDSLEAAQDLTGVYLEIPEDQTSSLSPDTYYHYQILDMEVWSVGGEHLGKVEEILATGSNDVYVVRGQGEEVLIPALKDVIVDVDTENGRITVALPEGLR